jgi:hypothetical protein
VCTGAKSEQQSKLAARKVLPSSSRIISMFSVKSFHKEGKLTPMLICTTSFQTETFYPYFSIYLFQDGL